MNETMQIRSQFHRISSTGDVIAVDRHRYLAMGDGNLDRDNITGQVINVWGDMYENVYSIYFTTLWAILADALKFKYRLRSFDYNAANFAWNDGLCEAATIIPTVWTHRPFLSSFATIWYDLFIEKPTPAQTSTFYISMLTSSSWIAVVGMILMLLGVMFSMYLLCPKTNKKKKFSYFMECFLFLCRVITNKATMKIPRQTSFRIFFISATMFSFMILIYYSTLLVSKIAITKTSLPINNLEDILEVKTHQVCTSIHDFYTMANKKESEWKDFIGSPDCTDSRTNFFREVCGKKLVGLYIEGVIGNPDEIKLGSCTVLRLKNKLFPQKILFGMSRRFPYKEQFRKMMFKMKNMGIHDFWNRRINHERPLPLKSHAPYQQVGFGSLSGLLLFYIFMVMISSIILVLEIGHHSFSEWKLQDGYRIENQIC